MTESPRRLQETIHEIAQAMRNHELVVYCGAGISRKSGIPVAKDQKDYILSKLPFDRSLLRGIDKLALFKDLPDLAQSNLESLFDDPNQQRLVFKDDFTLALEETINGDEARSLWWQLYKKTIYGKIVYRMPFEAFWESLSRFCPIKRAFQLYTKGIPNSTHLFLAKLAKSKYLQSIITTNFDLLLERAMSDEKADYTVFSNEVDFQKAPRCADRLSLIKIHGSAHDFESIRTTINQLTKRELSEARANVIRQVFAEGPHKKVLVIGYSWSDEFDLNPHIAALKDRGKFVYWIDHSLTHELVESLGGALPQLAVHGYPGVRIECDADRLVADLWAELLPDSISHGGGTTVWRDDIDAWLKEASSVTTVAIAGFGLAGSILAAVSEFAAAESYFRTVLDVATECGAVDASIYAFHELGQCHMTLGNYDKANTCFESALRFSEAAGLPLRAANALMGLGRYNHRRGDYESAFNHFEHALEIFIAKAARELEENCLRYMGEVLIREGQSPRAIEYLTRARNLCVLMGRKSEEGACLSSLANAWNLIGQHDDALDALLRALDIARKMGDQHGEAVVCTNLGAAYRIKEDLPKALECQERALDIFSGTGDKAGVARCHTNIGNIHRFLKNFQNALGHHVIAGAIADRLNNEPLQAMVAMNRGALFADMDNNLPAVLQYEKAAAFFEKFGDRHERAKCLVCIGCLHIKMMRIRDALEILRLAKAEFEQLGDGKNKDDCEKYIQGILLASKTEETYKTP